MALNKRENLPPELAEAYWLGSRFEIHHLAGNLTRCIEIEKRIGELQEKSEHSLVILVVRGRNRIRQRYNLEEINC